MKVLYLSTYEREGGAARAAHRLYTELKAQGVDMQMLTVHKTSRDPDVIPLFKAADPAKQSLWGVINQTLSHLLIFLDRAPRQIYRQRTLFAWSVGWLPTRIPQRIAPLKPDIIHLHWVGEGFVPIRAIRSFSDPVVWTFHDMWAFTGGCHSTLDCARYEQTCGQCPHLGSNRSHDLSRWTWQHKQKLWRDIHLTIITPSRWMGDCARSSSLLRNADIRVIPNGINLNQYRAIDKHVARQLLGLPLDKKIILFGAINSTSSPIKGFNHLQPALQQMAARTGSDRFELAIFGAPKPQNEPDFGFKAHYLDHIHDEQTIVALYSACDVFVAPFLQDNLSNMVIESLACSLPCVAFASGGMPDMIDHQTNGYLAKPFEIDDLAAGITWVLSDEQRWQTLSAHARQTAEMKFDLSANAQRYKNLYSEILDRKPT
ncbi:MAG: glycosyltransferase family 4 protein [Anaerolineae bacterium]|nr:glycosyltransferase family 4 protein [Anaerolineae bacterium]